MLVLQVIFGFLDLLHRVSAHIATGSKTSSQGQLRHEKDPLTFRYQRSLNYPFQVNQRMHMYVSFEGFPLNSALSGLVIQ